MSLLSVFRCVLSNSFQPHERTWVGTTTSVATGDAFFGPEFERSHQGVLGQFFCDADIVGDSGNGGDEPCGLDLPDGLNRLRHIFHAC